ncbi:hypothetical protein J6590_090780 [Homalodisca vitripennis]|nr:hypothetical protein J6590_090780 [Homalodisca vitripennis]
MRIESTLPTTAALCVEDSVASSCFGINISNDWLFADHMPFCAPLAAVPLPRSVSPHSTKLVSVFHNSENTKGRLNIREPHSRFNATQQTTASQQNTGCVIHRPQRA